MTCSTCADHPDCKNSKRVVLDTSVVIAILGFLCNQYTRQSTEDPRVTSFDDLCLGAEYFLEGLRCCASDGRLYVSSAVLANEISLRSKTSSVRNRVKFSSAIMKPTSAQCYASLEQVFQANLVQIAVSDGLVRALRGARGGSSDLSDEDMSLIGAAVLQSQGTEKVALLSHDEHLLDWVLKIRSCRQVLHEGAKLSTLHIEPEYGLTFLCAIHECCEIETSAFRGLTAFVVSKDIDRWEQGDLRSKKKVARKWRNFNRTWQAIVESALRKERNRLAAASA